MNRKTLNKWLKGLRSGEYVKGKNQLVTEGAGARQDYDEFCCLGVLCDVMGYEMSDNDSYHSANLIGDYESLDGILPTKIAAELGITENEQGILAELNDSGETSYFQLRKTGENVQYCSFGHEGDYKEIKFSAKTFRGIANAIERLLG